jgi:hypothetical protein
MLTETQDKEEIIARVAALPGVKRVVMEATSDYVRCEVHEFKC